MNLHDALDSYEEIPLSSTDVVMVIPPGYIAIFRAKRIDDPHPFYVQVKVAHESYRFFRFSSLRDAVEAIMAIQCAFIHLSDECTQRPDRRSSVHEQQRS